MKTRVLAFRINEEDNQLVVSAALRAGKSVGEFIRSTIRDAALGVLTKADESRPKKRTRR